MKDEQGNVLCRRCKKPVPEGRKTWCSDECWEQVHPQMRRRRIVKRDQRCQWCYAWHDKTNAEFGKLQAFVSENLGYSWVRRIHEIRPVWQIDHKTPLALGGSDEDDNLQLLCSSCHAKKTKQDIREIAQARRKKLDKPGQPV